MRKTFILLIALWHLIAGLFYIGKFLLPIMLPSGPFVLNIVPLVGGIFTLWAGLYLLRFYEIGRKLTIVLLYAQIVVNLLDLSLIDKSARLSVIFRDATIYKANAPYLFHAFLVTQAIVALGIILFLSSDNTRRLFAPEREEGKT